MFSATSFVREYWSAGLDSCTRTEYNVVYADDDVRNDTIFAYFSELPYHYSAYPGGKNLQTFGEYMFTYEPVNECRTTYNVHLVQRYARDTIVSNDTLCAGMGVEMHYSETLTNDNRSVRQADSLHLYIYNVYIADPVLYVDTVVVWSDSLPLFYHGQSFVQAGDYRLTEADEDGCTVLTDLHVVVIKKQDDALPQLSQTKQTQKFIHQGQLYILYRDAVYDARGNRITKGEIK